MISMSHDQGQHSWLLMKPPSLSNHNHTVCLRFGQGLALLTLGAFLLVLSLLSAPMRDVVTYHQVQIRPKAAAGTALPAVSSTRQWSSITAPNSHAAEDARHVHAASFDDERAGESTSLQPLHTASAPGRGLKHAILVSVALGPFLLGFGPDPSYAAELGANIGTADIIVDILQVSVII